MRHRRCIVAGLSTLSVALYLFGTVRVYAAGNDQASGNGAGLYAVYCSDCHGNAPAALPGEQSAPDATAGYAELVAITQRKVAEQKAVNPEEDYWPEWAEQPNPNVKEEPDQREEIMNLLVAAIEKAHETEPQSAELEIAEETTAKVVASGFKPMAGATDLSKPQTFFYGTSEEEVFKSIANGTGAAMPGWRTELGSDEAIWDVVRYIRSFWGEDWL